MEEDYFNEIRAKLRGGDIQNGKMMSSEAICYKEKVFAFFSKKRKMVFKLGKDLDPANQEIPMQVFNPFKNRGPLNGWFEVDFEHKEHWLSLTHQSLALIHKELD